MQNNCIANLPVQIWLNRQSPPPLNIFFFLQIFHLFFIFFFHLSRTIRRVLSLLYFDDLQPVTFAEHYKNTWGFSSAWNKVCGIRKSALYDDVPCSERTKMTLYLYVHTATACQAVLGIRDILVRIRIPGSVPLTNGSGSGSGTNSRSDLFLHWF